jgi:DNA-binding IclR family transcriptional regulator
MQVANQKARMGRDDPPVKATATSARVINALLELDGATVTEVADHLDLSKSSTHNHLETLQRLGYIKQDGWQYHASLKFLEIGTTVRRRYELYQSGAEEAERLANAGFTANLVVLEDDAAVCIETAIAEDKETVVDTGDRLPLHCTAAGKALLAALSREEAESLLRETQLTEWTDNTLTDQAALFEDLAEAQNRGLASNREEWHEGVRGIAAAITDADDALLGAISVTGSTEQLSGKTFQQDVSGLVLSSANRIRKRIRQE